MLNLEATLTPEDLCTAHDTEIYEYIAGVNADAKKMPTSHLRYGLRHAQLNIAITELERRACVRLLAS